jgi:hypothetical protein
LLCDDEHVLLSMETLLNELVYEGWYKHDLSVLNGYWCSLVLFRENRPIQHVHMFKTDVCNLIALRLLNIVTFRINLLIWWFWCMLSD